MAALSAKELKPALEGPKGIRVAGQTGNSGIFVIPKSAVKTEAEVKRLLTFWDQMMDPEMAVLLMRGVENKHYVKTSGNRTEFKDFTLYQREVKAYRDNERGRELELIIWDAQTKFIMGKISEADYQSEIEKWKKSGGQKLMDEYKAEAAKRGKK